jgi:hypothetical protein
MCHWKLYSCFLAFALCDIYRDGYRYVAALQECLGLLFWFMNNGQFPFLLSASRIFPDKKMESTVKRKLSLGTFLWSNGRTFCHMWTIMCKAYATMCMSRAAKPDFHKPLWSDNRIKSNIHPNIQTIYVPLGNIHQHLAVVFTSQEQSVSRQTVKWSASSLGTHSNSLTCG